MVQRCPQVHGKFPRHVPSICVVLHLEEHVNLLALYLVPEKKKSQGVLQKCV